MSTELTTATDFLTPLTQAATARPGQSCPAAATVITALLQAETQAKRQRLSYPLADLIGNWRLCFVTGTRKVRPRGGIALGKGFYPPRWAPAQIGFNWPTPDRTPPLEISNQVQLGAFQLTLTGPARFGKKNLMAFDFTQMQITLGRQALYRGAIRAGSRATTDFSTQPIAQLPFFAFFCVTPEFLAARGRGGGLALWAKVPQTD